MLIRPEDRHGITRGTMLAKINSALYLHFAKLWRTLPNGRGKVRIANEIYKFMGLENKHIFVEARMRSPTEYYANIDFHSLHERWAYLMSCYEEETVSFLARCYEKNGYFLDVGANIGLISVPFVKLTRTRDESLPTVFCIEAVRSNFERLVGNIELNGMQGTIKPIGVGVGEREKTVEIQVEGNLRDGEGTGTANILAEATMHPCERIPLQITTIDHLIEAGELPIECSLIKIDVDGYDLKVLEGATRLLESSRPIVFGEFMSHCLAWHGQTHRDVVDFLEAFDYEVFSKMDNSWTFLNIGAKEADRDLLLVPKEKISSLSWCLI